MSIATMVPDRTVAQRRVALEHANEIRLARARLKRELKAGASVLPVLVDPPEWLRGMKAYGLLVAVPKIGPKAAQRLLHVAGMSPVKTVGGMSPRQREALVAALGGRQG